MLDLMSNIYYIIDGKHIMKYLKLHKRLDLQLSARDLLLNSKTIKTIIWDLSQSILKIEKNI